MPEPTPPTAPVISALAQALDRVMPERMAAEVYGGGIRIRVRGQGAFRLVEVWNPRVGLEEFALDVLRAAQDEVIEEVTHTGWPPASPSSPDAPQFGERLPRPGAEVSNEGVLKCWYGDRNNPALVLAD